MNLLPDDVLDIIYKHTHELRLKDIHDELRQYRSKRINKVYEIIDLFERSYYMTSHSDVILLDSYTALRNDDVIDDYQLLHHIIDICNSPIIVQDACLMRDFYLKNQMLSIRNVIDKYDMYLGDLYYL